MRILNLLDPGIVDFIVGTHIDGALNAITLSHDYRRRFGTFKVCFEAVSMAKDRYIVKHVEPHNTPNVTVDFSEGELHHAYPPSPRLLAIHRACCLILKHSGVGDYLDEVVCDMQKVGF
jgi:hypothetical protein